MLYFATKIIIDFIVEDGSYAKESCSGKKWGVAGEIVLALLATLVLHRWYVVYMDNWYSTVQLASELFRRGFGMVGTYRTDRSPHLELISLGQKRPTAIVKKGMCKTAHNQSGTVTVYQVMDNKAVTIIDNFYDVTQPKEMIKVERHSVIRNALNVPIGLSRYNQKMGAVDTVDQMKGGHYSFETMHRTAKWNIKFYEMLIGLYQIQAWNIFRSI